MAKYLYSGPTSGVTLNVSGKPQEVMLHTGKEVELPEDNGYVGTLLALGHLTIVAAKPAATTATNKPAKEA
ncbi:MAG: hypothetical protein H6R04_704 [Burkholderiaceae bacterium]|nr:hypothetical protein [Burkholderiaceae bacterium]